MNTPLTQEEAAFATEHHDLVYTFLRRKNYSVDEHYDVAVFGFLRAVRDWHSKEALRAKYKFSTIAFTGMRSAMSSYFQSISRRKCEVIVFPLNNNRDTRVVSYNDVADNVDTIEAVRKALDMLSPRQREVARLKAAGLNNREIGERYGVTHERIRQEMVNALENHALVGIHP